MIETIAPVSFRSQYDDFYDRLIDEGIFPSFDTVNFCWLATLDMAVSPVLPRYQRDDFTRELVGNLNSRGLLLEGGKLDLRDRALRRSLWFLRQMYQQYGLPIGVSLEKATPPRIVNRLKKGKNVAVIINHGEDCACCDGFNNHFLFADELTAEQQVGFWDCDTYALEAARGVLPAEEIHFSLWRYAALNSKMLSFSYGQRR